jgi:flagellar protein FlgJ
MELRALDRPAMPTAVADVESLSARVRAGDPAAFPALAREFESVLLGQVLKEMRQTLESGGLFGSDPGDVHGGLFDLMMGRYLAAAGGMGLADVLTRQMAGSLPAAATTETAPCDPTRTTSPAAS